MQLNHCKYCFTFLFRCLTLSLTDEPPETKVLKQRVRDHLDPQRHLGHSDTHGKASKEAVTNDAQISVKTSSSIAGHSQSSQNATTELACEDCK
jgi:hypothetical protein